MGYTTEFKGKIDFDRMLTVPELRELEDMEDYSLQDEQFKKYAETWPESYNQWKPTKDGNALEWNGGEKFYDYTEWLKWLMANYFTPRDIKCNGEMTWQGEEIGDIGKLTVKDNEVVETKLEVTGMVECPNCGERFKPDATD